VLCAILLLGIFGGIVLGRCVLWRFSLCCILLGAASGARAQVFGNAEPVAESTTFELASNDSLPPVGNSLWPNESIPATFPIIKPDVPDIPSPVVTDSYVPLSAEERWRNFWNDTLLSPLSYVGALGGAYGQQISNQPRQWGNGFMGYTKRTGSNLAQFGSQEAIHQGGAALMRTDPRFQSCRCAGGLNRTWYALKMSFLTYKDDGYKTVDVPLLAGAYGGAIISEVPYPSHYSPFVQGVKGGNIQIGANVAINLFREFSPELGRLNPFRRHAEAK
jgi:hypothetical protein